MPDGYGACMAARCLRESGRKTFAEHGQAADGLRRTGLVLEHVPVFGQLAVLEADDIGGNPCGWPAIPGKPAMSNHVITFCHHELILVTQGVGQGSDQAEQSFTSGRNVGAVLDIGIRPEALGGSVVALVEERIEGFEEQCLVLCGVVVVMLLSNEYQSTSNTLYTGPYAKRWPRPTARMPLSHS
ncbi:hypothetical protein OKW32_007149 [Paraburkholderia youngii]